MTTNNNTPTGDQRNGYTPEPWESGSTPGLDSTEKAPRKRRRWVAPVVTGVLGLALGATAFGGGAGDTTAEPAATETITAEAKPAPTVTETATAPAETETVEVTPAVCLEYIDLSEQAFDVAAEMIGAAGEWDAAELDRLTAQLDTISPRSNAAKADCRAAA